MTKTFSPRFLFLVNRLQQQGIAFNLEESLTQSYNPLREALAAYFTVGELGALTYVTQGNTDQSRAEGFIQVRERRARPEADLLYLAPMLTADVAPDMWLRLLIYLIQQAENRGVERLFACLPQGSEETRLFAQAGFNIYTHQDVYRLAGQGPATDKNSHSPDATIRPYHAQDIIAVQQLYAAVAPRQVQQAESGSGRGRFCPLDTSSTAGDKQSFVLEKNDEIVGCLTIKLGRIGHWLHILLHPRAYDLAGNLLAWGIDRGQNNSPEPIYCGVRDYQGGLRAVLEDMGFQHLVCRALAVKHTTVRVTDPIRALRPALEKRAEVTTPSVSQANGHQAAGNPEPIK